MEHSQWSNYFISTTEFPRKAIIKFNLRIIDALTRGAFGRCLLDNAEVETHELQSLIAAVSEQNTTRKK
jgi:hypothetical protein